MTPKRCDCQDFLADASDMMHRLSAQLPPHPPYSGSAPPLLSANAQLLLRTAVAQPVGQAMVAYEADPEGLAALKAFISHPGVGGSTVWHDLFQAMPPRGVLARLARRIGAPLSPLCGYWNYRTRMEMRAEKTRISRWYRRGRQVEMSRRGIKRKAGAPDYVQGEKETGWTKAVSRQFLSDSERPHQV